MGNLIISPAWSKGDEQRLVQAYFAWTFLLRQAYGLAVLSRVSICKYNFYKAALLMFSFFVLDTFL